MPIQHVLFFKPLQSRLGPPTRRHNPLLTQIDCFIGNAKKTPRANPRTKLPGYHSYLTQSYFRAELRAAGSAGQENTSFRFENVVLNTDSPKSSWRRMLLQQPPVDYTVGPSVFGRNGRHEEPFHYLPVHAKKGDTIGRFMPKLKRKFREFKTIIVQNAGKCLVGEGRGFDAIQAEGVCKSKLIKTA